MQMQLALTKSEAWLDLQARPVIVDAVETGDLDAVVDPRLEGAYNRGEMIVMVEAAAACVRHSAPKRPRMVQVIIRGMNLFLEDFEQISRQ